jgi:hypothetical protein
VKSADQTILVTTQVNLADLAAPINAPGVYVITARLLVSSSAATVGARPALSFPAGAAVSGYRSEVPASANTSAVAHSTAGVATAGNVPPSVVILDAVARYVNTPNGNIQPTMAAETTGGVTVHAGSVLNVRKVA